LLMPQRPFVNVPTDGWLTGHCAEHIGVSERPDDRDHHDVLS
jgi:hypothetical protein